MSGIFNDINDQTSVMVAAGARSGSATVPRVWTRPGYSRTRINAAGATLIDPGSSLPPGKQGRSARICELIAARATGTQLRIHFDPA